MAILTVSQLNRYLSFRFQEDSNLRMILLRGELSNFTRNFRSGHCYFSVRDAEASVRAVLFRSNADRLAFEPENGMHVLIQATVTVYERDGVYQLNVTDMQPDGLGTQALALQQRREKLAKLGYFDAARKRPIPAYPQKVGVVTSNSGAALQDILQILERRCPLCEVCLYPALVQGDAAPQSIADALTCAGQDDCDVILVGRGGGSKEDLSAFQTEIVATAIFHCPVPVISAVGHETDTCIADDVADLRAPTPSAAAELAVPDIQVLLQLLDTRMEQLTQSYLTFCDQRGMTLERLWHRLERLSVDHRLAIQTEQLSAHALRAQRAIELLLEERQQRLELLCSRMEAVSPMAVLQRGYALAYQNQTLVRSATSLAVGQTLTLQFADGTCAVTVTRIPADAMEDEKTK